MAAVEMIAEKGVGWDGQSRLSNQQRVMLHSGAGWSVAELMYALLGKCQGSLEQTRWGSMDWLLGRRCGRWG